jgi:hypothetical protein
MISFRYHDVAQSKREVLSAQYYLNIAQNNEQCYPPSETSLKDRPTIARRPLTLPSMADKNSGNQA